MEQEERSNVLLPDPTWQGGQPKMLRAEPIKARVNNGNIQNRYLNPEENFIPEEQNDIPEEIENTRQVNQVQGEPRVVMVGRHVSRRVEVVERIEPAQKVVYPITQKAQKK